MFKFNKEDIGMYVVFATGGAGVGFLAGSLVSILLAKRRMRSEHEWLQAEFSFEQDEPKDRVERIISNENYVSVVEEEYEEEDEEFPEVVEDGEVWDEIEDFIDRVKPSDIHVTMLRKGDMTMEEVLEVMAEQKVRKDYSAIYNNRKPSLDELISDDEIGESPDDEPMIDGRWTISEDFPVDRDPKNTKVVYWDEERDSFYRPTRNSTVEVTLSKLIPTEVWNVVHLWFDKGYDTIFVSDEETVKVVRIEKDAADERESATEVGGS